MERESTIITYKFQYVTRKRMGTWSGGHFFNYSWKVIHVKPIWEVRNYSGR